MIAPAGLRDAVVELLRSDPATADLVAIPGARIDPPGDLIQCDLAEESASVMIEQLREIGVTRDGSVTVSKIDAIISRAALKAALDTPGSAQDAVLWEAVEEQAAQNAEPAWSLYLLEMIATLIAAIGLLTDSLVLIIGAMIVGPEYGPLSALSLGLVRRKRHMARDALVSVVVAFLVAIVGTAAISFLVARAGIAPPDYTTGFLTLFVSEPSLTAVWVAFLAGLAGMISILNGASGSLIGVLVSVTTVPAAAAVSLSIAYSDYTEFWGAGLQLIVNLVAIVIAGILVLVLVAERAGFVRRLRAKRRSRIR